MELVWYVSYGSNLSAERFLCYIEGGTPRGAAHAMPGCRDTSAPRGSRRVELPFPLVFGGLSKVGNGGPVFLDMEVPGRTLARAWLITREQFCDVTAQENYLPVGSVSIPSRFFEEGGVLLPSSRYGRLVAPPIEGICAATFTCTERPTPRLPDPAYLRFIVSGLCELGLSRQEVMAYLRSLPQLKDFPIAPHST